MLRLFQLGVISVFLCGLSFCQTGTEPSTLPSAVDQAAAASSVTVNPLGRARALFRTRDFEGAIAQYRIFLQTHPNSPDAYAGITRAYLKEKEIDSAAETVKKGLALSDAPRMHVALGEVLFRQGKIGEAEQEWVKVINSGYPDAHAYLDLARVRRAIAKYKTAKSLVDKAHELDPGDPDVEEAWVNTLGRAERIKYLENSLSDPNNLDPDERQNATTSLVYLRERAKQPRHGCRLASTVTRTEASLVRLLSDPTHLRGYGLTVSVNGHKSNLLLDTGASGIVVKRSIAEKAGVGKIAETKSWGVGDKGPKNSYVGIADSIRIGELEFQNCPIDVIEGRSVAEEDGLVGADVFEDFLVDIDFPDEKLKLSELPKRPGETARKPELNSENDDDPPDSELPQGDGTGKPASDKKEGAATNASQLQDRYVALEMEGYTHIFRFGHLLLVPTMIGDVPQKLFLLDTGALTNTISPAAAREVTKVHNDDTIVKGISGRVNKVYEANKAVLQFGKLRQENQDITAFDTTSLSEDAGTEISGFLGFAMLRFLDIKIDYRDALIDFSYDAKHWHMPME